LLDIPWLEHGFGSRRSGEWNRQSGIVSLKQVHSDICMHLTGGEGRVGEGDALLTDVSGLRLAVRTADCIPILLVDTRARAVAAVHAGWRGTARSICAKAVAALREHFGSRPEDMLAAVGPGIGPCCYEVGPEVAIQFRDTFPERNDLNGRAHLDLPEANRRQLLTAGLPAGSICLARLCTCCSCEEFHSWRRDRESSGRMISLVSVRPA